MINYEKFSEIELFIKVKKYDPYALEELYLRYSPILYPLAARIVNDYKIAEEIIIDTFVAFWRKIDLFNFDSGNTYTWLITLTRNKAIAKIRSKQFDISPTSLDYDEYENLFLIPDLDKKIEPLDLLSAMKKKDSIITAVNRLTEAQKYVLYLSYYDGYTVNNIAEKLSIPLATIRSKIMISIHSLRNMLTDGPTTDADNNDINEMVAAYAIGCMDTENHVNFRKHKEVGGYIPEKRLGELQTTVSFLPIVLNEIPVDRDLKDRLGYKLLETHKKIIDGSLLDSRTSTKSKLSKPSIVNLENKKKPEPFSIQSLDSEERESPFRKNLTESEFKRESFEENSKSKLFWFFNFMLLAGLIVFSFLLSDETSKLNEKVGFMKQQLAEINSETSAAKNFITKHMAFIEFFRNPNVIIVPLIGGKESPKSHGRFFVSFDSGEGLLELKKIPEFDLDKNFTLWIKRGKSYENLASFSVIPNDDYIKITQIPTGQREHNLQFVITLESTFETIIPSSKVVLTGKFLDP